ncbi:uncharacterized protein LOC116164550 [Photinus pyralis]|uniref:uncharacterized protein LOC116164550 n=1 Tax=Photinus pyralis TaxID=7054 RepID=UPI0012671123|nr:uncharacterized protein LOC116164550 [Photinus pyralis]
MSTVQKHLMDHKVTNLLKQILTNQKDRYTIEISNATKPGENWMGLMKSVIVNYQDDDNRKLYLIAKLAPHQDVYRKVFPIKIVYLREIYVYDYVIPEFLKLQEEKQLEQIFQPFARCYTISRAKGNEAIVMENLKIKGFVTGDHHTDVDYSHALLVVKELGRFHAMSYAIRDHKPKVYERFEQDCQETFFNSHMFTPVLTIFRKLGAAVLKSYDPVKDTRQIESLQKSLQKVPRVFRDLRCLQRYGRYSVVNHGDVQMRNLLFKYADETHPLVPTELCMIDWQVARVGSPAFDLLYFFFVCTNREFRGLHYTNLLEEYYKSLAGLLRQLGSKPEELLPYSVLLDHLKSYGAYALYTSMWILSSNMKKEQDIPDIYNSITETANVDHFSTIPNDDYIPRIRDLIDDLLEYGYDF